MDVDVAILLLCRLRDESSHVRKNTLMVLTHLILNDMVKVKGQISEMATCLEDKDSRISDLTKLFFLELSKKVRKSVYQIRSLNEAFSNKCLHKVSVYRSDAQPVP